LVRTGVIPKKNAADRDVGQSYNNNNNNNNNMFILYSAFYKPKVTSPSGQAM